MPDLQANRAVVAQTGGAKWAAAIGLQPMRPKDVVRNNFPYLHRRIWAHSVVARRLFSQLHGASCA